MFDSVFAKGFDQVATERKTALEQSTAFNYVLLKQQVTELTPAHSHQQNTFT